MYTVSLMDLASQWHTFAIGNVKSVLPEPVCRRELNDCRAFVCGNWNGNYARIGNVMSDDNGHGWCSLAILCFVKNRMG